MIVKFRKFGETYHLSRSEYTQLSEFMLGFTVVIASELGFSILRSIISYVGDVEICASYQRDQFGDERLHNIAGK